jgi:FMN phosphatase YigB (HAD superfamily)
MSTPQSDNFFSNVKLLSLDAGNTLVYLDHARVARSVGMVGITAATLQQAEGRAKQRAENGSLLQNAFAGVDAPGAKSWAAMVATMLAESGVPENLLGNMLDSLWRSHCQRNLWSLVPNGLIESLQRVRLAGVQLAVVSNSEGKLRELLTAVGLATVFDRIIDSGIVGIEKPDPGIFALGRGNVDALQVLHLGDVYATDIVGARAAGIRCALIDPFGHYAGRFPEIRRVESVNRVCDILAPAHFATLDDS